VTVGDGSERLDKAPDAFRTISEVATDLDVPQHVLRFWETRFSQIRPMKRSGGRRYYRPDDIDLLRGIRHLLYGEGYTIRGVQRILREQGFRVVQAIGQGGSVPQAIGRQDDDAAPIHAIDVEDIGDEEGDDLAERMTPELKDFRVSAVESPAMRAEPAYRAPASPARAAGGSAAEPIHASTKGKAGLRREDIRKLEATLHELVECRRLIDAAEGA
jgi:DNA-binding transcriptional MerR regulator